MTTRFRLLCANLWLVLSCGAGPAQAALYDEIQVYDDTINEPGEVGVELHVNTTLSGRSTPEYPGEVTPAHGLRVTPEFSYGLTKTFEAGLYLPLVRDRDNRYYLAGSKVRLKWIGQKTPTDGGFFYGANFELSHVDRRFEQATNGFELRPIFGYRDQTWLLVTNPVLGYSLNKGYRNGGLDFSPSEKVSRRIADGLAFGFEVYSDVGKLAKFAPRAEQNHTLYAVIDVDRGPWVFNLGIGRGLNPATDRWTVKAIFDLPL
jgi:hypothetical protein